MWRLIGGVMLSCGLSVPVQAQSAAAPATDAAVALTAASGGDAPGRLEPGLLVESARWHADRWTGRWPSGSLLAQAAGAGGSQPSFFDRVWRFAEWYHDDSNSVVQRVQFSGRYQHDFVVVDADQGDHAEQNVRRLRVGSKVSLIRTVTLHAELELNPQEHDPLYVRLTDAYLQWARSGQLQLTVGKQSVPFTMDGSTSSKELVTIDRSNLANNMWFPQEYLPGASVSGRLAPWHYRVGVYSAGAANREFGEFTGDLAALVAAGYDLADRLGVEEAVVAGNYVYQHPDEHNTFTRSLRHIGSVNVRLAAGRWGVRADVSAADGYLGQSRLWGVMVMPFADVTDRLQLVGRYTFLESADVNGVRLATYENDVVSGRGDRYDEVYAGANYYVYGHRLKVQTGVQVADMDDRAADGGAYDGISWVTGLRVGW